MFEPRRIFTRTYRYRLLLKFKMADVNTASMSNGEFHERSLTAAGDHLSNGHAAEVRRPFLIGVAGGTASGKVGFWLFRPCDLEWLAATHAPYARKTGK